MAGGWKVVRKLNYITRIADETDVEGENKQSRAETMIMVNSKLSLLLILLNKIKEE